MRSYFIGTEQSKACKRERGGEGGQQPYETSEQESKQRSNSNSNSISPRASASLGQKQRHLRWKPFHALFMLFINALCVVCATINSSKNGCFLRLYEEMKHFSFFANFSVFLFLCCCWWCWCYCWCCCCLFYFFPFEMETAECYIQRQTKSTHVGCDEENYAQQTNERTNKPTSRKTRQTHNYSKAPTIPMPDRILSLPLAARIAYSVLFLSVLIYKTAHFVRFCIEIELNFSGSRTHVYPKYSTSSTNNK